MFITVQINSGDGNHVICDIFYFQIHISYLLILVKIKITHPTVLFGPIIMYRPLPTAVTFTGCEFFNMT